MIAPTSSPQCEAALYARLVRDDRHVRLQRELDLPGVAATDIETVEVGQPAQIADRLLDALVPSLAADFLARRIAELLVVGLAIAERMMGELEMRCQAAIEVEPGAEPSPQRHHHLDPLAGDHRQALQVGV